MKKLVSMVVALAMACVLSVSAFAAGSLTKAELQDKLNAYAGSANADMIAAAQNAINALDDTDTGITADTLATIKSAASSVQAAIDTGDVATIESAISAAQATVNGALAASGLSVTANDVKVSATDGKVTAYAVVSKNGGAVASATASGRFDVEESNDDDDDKDNSSSSSSATTATTSSVVTSTAGVIKATGLDFTAMAAVLVLAVASVFGVAVVKNKD